MVKVLEINNLNYHDFKSINISFDKNKFYTIIGGSGSGKTTLFHLISGIIPTTNKIFCAGIYLNSNSINSYIQKIGVVERINKNSFIYQKVYDEMSFPLYNLGLSKKKRDYRIKEVLSAFNLTDLIDKNINELDDDKRQLLLIMIALLHKPKVLLLDSVFNIFSKEDKKELIKVLENFIVKEDITIINFSLDLYDAFFSDKLILLSHFAIIGEYDKDDIYRDDKLFYQNGLEIPFITDLSVKLKVYNIINKNYSDMKEMVNDIWP